MKRGNLKASQDEILLDCSLPISSRQQLMGKWLHTPYHASFKSK